MANDHLCWKCGQPLAALTLPLERLAECPACLADLHVCRMCFFYNSSVSDHCDEPLAQAVMDATRANFCDYFKAKTSSYTAGKGGAQDKARAELAALFGLSDEKDKASQNESRKALDALFGLERKDSPSGKS